MIKKFLKMILPGCSLSQKIYYKYYFAKCFYEKGFVQIAKYLSYSIYRKYHCCISYKAQIGKNLLLPHPIGIVIGEGVVIEDNCIIYQNVTIGRKNREINEYPSIGKNVIIYCNSTILGNIKIGDNTIIGCNTVVLKTVEKNSKCIGVVK